MNTAIEIIDETVEYYSVTERRSVLMGRCQYKHPNGNECAFQRCVETDLSNFDGYAATHILDSKILGEPVVFKPGYPSLSSLFWRDLQILHDMNDNWNAEGLSERGKEYVEELKLKYK